MPVLSTFSSIMMLTLTVDPTLFRDAEEAFWYCRDQRAVSEFIRAVKKAGYLESGRYFCIIEWQKNGFAHFHLLVETKFIPHTLLAQLWGRNRPSSAPAWEGDYSKGDLKGCRPEFGSVFFSHGEFQDAKHAVGYALKYLTKQPEQGFPDWVLDSKKRIRIYSTSRGLLTAAKEEPAAENEKPSKQPRHRPECFCDDCRESDEDTLAKPYKEPKSIREKMSVCAVKAVVLHVHQKLNEKQEVMKTRRRFWRLLRITFKDALREIGCEEIKQRNVRLKNGEWWSLSSLTPKQTFVGEQAGERGYEGLSGRERINAHLGISV